MFHTIVLVVHGWARWIVVILAVYALVRAYSGWLGKRAWTPEDRRAGMLFTTAMDVQLLLGLILVAVDLVPLGGPGLERFFLFWHIPWMIVAVVLAHVGSAGSRKAANDASGHRLATLWFTVSVIAVLVAIPWSRPLLRL